MLTNFTFYNHRFCFNVSVNNVLKEYDDMKEETIDKNINTRKIISWYKKYKMDLYCIKYSKFTKTQ